MESFRTSASSLRTATKRSLLAWQAELRFQAWRRRPEGRANAQRLEALGQRYAGRRCFVMGNGPSLLACDLNLLADEVTIVSNAHYLMWDQLDYVPTLLTVEDELVAEDRRDELRRLRGVAQVYPYDLRPLLGPATPERVYINFHREYIGFPKFSENVRRRAYWGGTVSFLNLQLAAYIGCNPIILIGFDHRYAVPDDRRTGNVITSDQPDVNHFDPSYFGPGYRWHDPNVDRMELAYRTARTALARRGISVFNATVGGNLEVFDRVDFKSVAGGR